MDFNKLKTFLDSRQKSTTGKMWGIPTQTEEVPNVEEIQGMPQDLQDVVVQSQLRRGGFDSISNPAPEDKLQSEMAMADEISGEEYGTPSFFTESDKHKKNAQNVYNFSKLKDYFKK